MGTIKVVIEPDVLITRIGKLGQRGDMDIPTDSVGLEVRIRNLHALFNRKASVAVSPNTTYDEKRDLIITIGEELLALADAGYESEAMNIVMSGGTVGGLGMCGGYMRTYFDLIPPEKRAEEYKLRERVETKS